jgi:glycogen debranching enzyme
MLLRGWRVTVSKDHAIRIFGGLFAASLFVEYRLPELFCGFDRREGEGPVPYRVACSPQAWSARVSHIY